MHLAVVDKLFFQGIGESQHYKFPVGNYLAQFPGNYGILAFHDMITEFFGAVTDINSVSYFATLTTLFEEAEKMKKEHIVLDVEPTAGLERLLGSTKAISRSFQLLRDLGTMKKMVLGQAWPDIRAFLDGSYVQNAGTYAPKLEITAQTIRDAKYRLVCVPEQGPVEQMGEVKQLVESYGGRVHGYIVNNVREDSDEQRYINEVVDASGALPVTVVDHDPRLHGDDIDERREFLREMGERFV